MAQWETGVAAFHPLLAAFAGRPDVLGLSCLLTSGYEALRETIDLVRAQSSSWHPHLPIVLGGAAVDEIVNERLGADGWCVDAARGLGFVRALFA